MDALPPGSTRMRGWPAWASLWGSILLSTLVAVVVLARLSSDGARAAVERALDDHLSAEAGLADAALQDLPIEILAAMVGERSAIELGHEVDRLAAAGRLRGLALLGPKGQVMGQGSKWVPAAAEADLIAAAVAGQTVHGPLYHDDKGELFATAYRPLTGHPGWVVAVEGSAATLGAVDDLARAEAEAGVAVLAVAALFGALLARWWSRPLGRLERELASVRPGDPPEVLGDFGFREVRRVADAGRRLLEAIRLRDVDLQAAHQRELDQVHRMAAEIAHEVGNPLNAVALSVDRLATLADASQRALVVERVRTQIGELEGIVERLRDLTRPLRPELATVALDSLLAPILQEVEGLTANVEGVHGLEFSTDKTMVGEIVRNLLLNARQAGARTATLTVRREGSWLWLDVMDDGPGVPEDQVALVFAWFHTTRAQGTGLGLPLSRRLAAALGGRLELIVPKPATFRLSLPLERAP